VATARGSVGGVHDGVISGSSSADAADRAALGTPRSPQVAHRLPTARNGRALLLRNEGGARNRDVIAADGAAWTLCIVAGRLRPRSVSVSSGSTLPYDRPHATIHARARRSHRGVDRPNCARTAAATLVATPGRRVAAPAIGEPGVHRGGARTV
jgi:hypothetical protein